MAIRHTTVVTGANDPTKEVSKDAWNDDHTNPDIADVTGLQAELDALQVLAQGENIFRPEDYGALANAFGAHDGVWDGTWFSSASYDFIPDDVGIPFHIDSTQRIITAVGTGANAGKMQSSPSPTGTTGIMWLKGSDDSAAIQEALDTASAVMKRGATEDSLGINSYIPSGGIVVLTPGKAYGIFNSSASYSGGKTACVRVHRRTTLTCPTNNSSQRAALIILPGTYGDGVGNTSDTSYSDLVTISNITIYGYTDFQSSNARDGIRWVTPVGSYDKTDTYSRFENITVDRCRRNGFTFTGRGGVVIEKCDGIYNQNYGIYAFGQYDYKVLGCDFGGNKKTGVRIYASGSGTWSNCKSFYNGASGGTNEKDSANWVIEGDQMRAGFTFFSNCEAQESRGSSWIIGTGMNIFTNCKAFDPNRNGMNSGTLPTIMAGWRFLGEGCRQNTFAACFVGPSVAVYSATNWNADTYAVYIDDYSGAASGPQLNQGEIWTYRETLNAGPSAQVGIQYSGTGQVKGGGGITNGLNPNLYIDGVPCAATITPASGDLIEVIDISDTTASASGTKKLVAVSSLGGGGATTLTTVEKNLGTSPRRSGKFTITGLSGLTTNKPVSIMQAVGPYTGKGTLMDEAEMDGLTVSGVVTSATEITAYWNATTRVKGNFKFNYFVGA